MIFISMYFFISIYFNGRAFMKNTIMFIVLLALITSGCSGAFWGGAGAGALGAGAGYEYAAAKQMQQIDEELKSGKITQQEYDIRKDQIKRGSLFH
jgi:hypothetical protein